MDYCKCSTPKKKVEWDDRGEKVVYCDKCWKVIKEKKDES